MHKNVFLIKIPSIMGFLNRTKETFLNRTIVFFSIVVGVLIFISSIVVVVYSCTSKIQPPTAVSTAIGSPAVSQVSKNTVPSDHLSQTKSSSQSNEVKNPQLTPSETLPPSNDVALQRQAIPSQNEPSQFEDRGASLEKMNRQPPEPPPHEISDEMKKLTSKIGSVAATPRVESKSLAMKNVPSSKPKIEETPVPSILKAQSLVQPTIAPGVTAAPEEVCKIVPKGSATGLIRLSGDDWPGNPTDPEGGDFDDYIIEVRGSFLVDGYNVFSRLNQQVSINYIRQDTVAFHQIVIQAVNCFGKPVGKALEMAGYPEERASATFSLKKDQRLNIIVNAQFSASMKRTDLLKDRKKAFRFAP